MVSFEWKINLQSLWASLILSLQGKSRLTLCSRGKEILYVKRSDEGGITTVKRMQEEWRCTRWFILLFFFSGQTTASRLSSRHEGEGWMWVAFAFLIVSFLAALRRLCNSSRYFLQHFFGKARRDHRYHNNSTRRMICKLLDLFVTYFFNGKFAVNCG